MILPFILPILKGKNRMQEGAKNGRSILDEGGIKRVRNAVRVAANRFY